MKDRTLSKKWIFWGVNGILALFAVVCLLMMHHVCTALPTLNAANTWAGESQIPFAQLACYLPSDKPVEEQDVWSFRQTLEKQLTEAAMEAPENGSLYTDAYSGQGTLTVTAERGNAQVKVIGVGGDYFRFHPLQLRSGSYLAETDLMQDRVILDEELAWKLFGGMDLTGLSVTINGADYYVAGVVSREDDRYSSLAYTDGAGMFMSYSALKACNESTAISCYEIAMPNPITAFSRNLVQEHFPLNGGVLVENSSRYSLGNLLDVIGDFGKRSMGLNGIIYPYWENAVRLTEDYAALLLVLTVLFALLPTISVILQIIRWIKRCWRWVMTMARDKTSGAIERHREKTWQQRAGKKDSNGKSEV